MIAQMMKYSHYYVISLFIQLLFVTIDNMISTDLIPNYTYI